MRALRVLCLTTFGLAAATGIATVACGPPSSFDGLVGGSADAGTDGPRALAPDDGLPAPRAIGPVHASWVNGSRPHLRWQLAPGTTGARVEFCRNRFCDGPEKKTWDANGDDFTVPEELAAGVWFWRLYGKTADTVGRGQSVSPFWAVLVRGGKGSGGASGVYADFNGDGRPDLAAAIEETRPDGGTTSVLTLHGSGADIVPFDPDVARSFSASGSAPEIAVADVSGDGFSDLTTTDIHGGQPFLSMLYGGVDGVRYDEFVGLPLPVSSLPVSLRESGDLDRDGYGDLLVSSRDEVMVLYGTPRGPGPLGFFVQLTLGNEPDSGLTRPDAAYAIHGSFDRESGGVSDIALSTPYDGLPLLLIYGAAGRGYTGDNVAFGDATAPSLIRTITSGDLDGDGLADVAFTASNAGVFSVCVLLGATPVPATGVSGYTCWAPPAPIEGFGTSLVTADLDANGTDEVLVGSATGGVHVLSWTGSALGAEHLDTPYGAPLTVLWPGRPGPAVWIASRADGSSLGAFRGRDLAAPVTVPSAIGAARFGKTVR